jgi:hypothetical protein
VRHTVVVGGPGCFVFHGSQRALRTSGMIQTEDDLYSQVLAGIFQLKYVEDFYHSLVIVQSRMDSCPCFLHLFVMTQVYDLGG